MPRSSTSSPTTSELVLAFRQAKRAFASERMMVGLSDFARFELDLDSQLRRLRASLRNGAWFSNVPLGRTVVVPKSFSRSEIANRRRADRVVRVGHPDDVISGVGTLAVRLQLVPSPQFATTEVLYLRAFGPAFESLLSPSCVAYRLKRVAHEGKMDRESLDVYEHWQSAFARYRDDPVSAARDILTTDNGRAIIVSTDVVSFFDSIDPSFLLTARFIARLKASAAKLARPFDAESYDVATRSLLDAYERFRRERNRFVLSTNSEIAGIPIGSLTSRLVANVALAPLDAHISTRPGVVLYRRYVDDIAIVKKVRKNAPEPESKIDVLAEMFPNLSTNQSGQTFTLPDGELLFRLKDSKTRIHDLAGVAGREFLEAVQHSFVLATSERRALLGNIDRLGEQIEVIDLFDGEVGAADHIPRLRDADRFTLRRFMATSFVQTLERYILLLDPESAKGFISKRISRILAVLDSAELLENIELVLDLLRIAVMLRHPTLCDRLNKWLDKHIQLLVEVQSISWREQRLRRVPAINGLAKYLRDRRSDTVASTADYRNEPNLALRARALQLRHTDLRHLDRDDDAALFGNAKAIPPASRRGFTALQSRLRDRSLQKRINVTAQFITTWAADKNDPWHSTEPLSALLASKPPDFSDVARRILSGVEHNIAPRNAGYLIAQTVDAIRGTRYLRRPSPLVIRRDERGPTVSLQSEQPKIVRVMVANLPVEKADFEAAAKGTARVTIKRLQALDHALREAKRATSKARHDEIPTLLVFPELSIPRRVGRSLRQHASREGISLVAGLEYRRDPYGVINEAIGVFPLGFDRSYALTWSKRHPAHGEASLLSELGITFVSDASNAGRLVVESQHGRFGVLICSEILESAALAELTKRVELLIVPAWNEDTATFDHVTHSVASMLVHCFVAVANNAEASDSRAFSGRTWAPIPA